MKMDRIPVHFYDAVGSTDYADAAGGAFLRKSGAVWACLGPSGAVWNLSGAYLGRLVPSGAFWGLSRACLCLSGAVWACLE